MVELRTRCSAPITSGPSSPDTWPGVSSRARRRRRSRVFAGRSPAPLHLAPTTPTRCRDAEPLGGPAQVLNRLDEAELLSARLSRPASVLERRQPVHASAINYLGRILSGSGQADQAEPCCANSSNGPNARSATTTSTRSAAIPLGTCLGKPTASKRPRRACRYLPRATATPDNAGKVKPTVEGRLSAL
jgi:hypothetical protein